MINDPHIKQFLDALDVVLNSNSFLLETSIHFEDSREIMEDTTEFILSGEFETQIRKQDLQRGWGNYYRKGVPTSGSFIKDNFRLELNGLANEAVIPYLRNMLTIENKDQTVFYSPYNKQMEREKAEQLTVNFLNGLMQQMKWKAFQLNTDFAYTKTERGRKNMESTYFEGDFGSDSATLFIREDNSAFLLLTNGID